MVQTPVVKIDRADDRLCIIADEYFGMHKSRRIFIYLYASVVQSFIMSLCQSIRHGLVRYARHYYLYIDPSLGSKGQGVQKLIVKNEIRSHNMNIFRCSVDHIYVYRFSCPVLVKRAVAVRHDITRGVLRHIARSGQPGLIVRIALSHIPHLKEHKSKTPDRISLKHHCSILPVTESYYSVDILIRQIDPAVESDFSVDHKYLAVITIIEMRRHYRYYR